MLKLKGKPAPDAFLEAARRSWSGSMRSALVEDAIAGVAASDAPAIRLRHRRGSQRTGAWRCAMPAPMWW